MDTTDRPLAEYIDPVVMADAQAVIDKLVHGTPIPSDVSERIRTEAARIRREMFEKHGLLDIGVPAIRELRDGD